MRHVNHARPLDAPTLIGRTRTGKPVWSIAGAATDDGGETDDGEDGEEEDDDGQDDDSGDGDDDQDDDQDDSDEELGPKGKKALERMKQERRDLKRQLREARQQNNTKTKQDGDDELDADQLREQVRQELEAETARDRALDKLEVKAAKKFADPEDARALLEKRADDFLDEKGKPDVEAIDEALEELLENKPHLAAQRGKWRGDGDGGARRSKPTRAKTIGEAVGQHYTKS